MVIVVMVTEVVVVIVTEVVVVIVTVMVVVIVVMVTEVVVVIVTGGSSDNSDGDRGGSSGSDDGDSGGSGIVIVGHNSDVGTSGCCSIGSDSDMVMAVSPCEHEQCSFLLQVHLKGRHLPLLPTHLLAPPWPLPSVQFLHH